MDLKRNRLFKAEKVAFGQLIKQYRKEKGLAKDELLELLKKNGFQYSSIGAISNWERGMHIPQQVVVEILANIFETNSTYLLKASGYIIDD